MSREDGELSDESPKSVGISDQDDFVIDKNFSGIIENEELEKEPEPVLTEKKPSDWQKQMRKRLLVEPGEHPEEKPQNKRRRLNCFNCSGDHNIAQCPEPRDMMRIRKNKAEFMESQKPAGRISKSVEEDSKFKPGRLSHKLRSALNLGPDDIPEWVYRMRRMGFHKGYPPGHLKNALQKEYNTIKIFSDDKVKKSEEIEEAEPTPVVDSKKIHWFMGFNKTYAALRDIERGRFEVPPFEIFCEMLQSGVKRDHDASETIRLYEESVIRQQKDLEKVEVLTEEIFVDLEKTNGPDDVEIDKADRKTPSPSKPIEVDGILGESISQLIGTPVVSRRDNSGLWVEDSVPSLEAFAVGIVPFEAKEEEQSRGIFKKIMSTLRKEK